MHETRDGSPAPIGPQGWSVAPRVMANDGDDVVYVQLPLRRLLRLLGWSHPTPLPDRECDKARADSDLGRERSGSGNRVRLVGLVPVASTVTVTTMARDTSNPDVHAAPFRAPRFEGSTTMKADNGSGRALSPGRSCESADGTDPDLAASTSNTSHE